VSETFLSHLCKNNGDVSPLFLTRAEVVSPRTGVRPKTRTFGISYEHTFGEPMFVRTYVRHEHLFVDSGRDGVPSFYAPD